jgi:hypothetical protein
MNRQLDRIAAVVLFVFVLGCLVLLIAATGYFQVHPIHTEVAPEIQAEIQVLQATTEELQETIDHMQAQAGDREVSENLEVIDQTLAEMSEQIEEIGDDLGALPTEEPGLAGAALVSPSPDAGDEAVTFQDVLLILLGWIVGVLSILTAAAWACVVIMRGKRRRKPLPTPKEMW